MKNNVRSFFFSILFALPFISYSQRQSIVLFENEELKENEIKENDQVVIDKIKVVLEEYVKPAVESDGGAISFRSFDDGKVTVLLQGSCSGCPSATVTLKNGVENLLKKMVPEVTEVVADGIEVV